MAVYYVDMAVGNDLNLGTSEGAGNAWKTLGHAATSVAAGDKVWVKASADYTEVLTISVVGTTTAPVIWEGYTTTIGDNGVATINGGGARATGIVPAAGGNFQVFKNLRATAHTSHGVGSTLWDHATFKHCRFDNNGGNGVVIDENAIFEGCYAHNNTSSGFRASAGAGVSFIGCISNSNGASGISFDTGVCYRCICFANATIGFEQTGTFQGVFIECLSDGNNIAGSKGFRIAQALAQSNIVVVNCIAYRCAIGFESAVGLDTERTVSMHNLVNACTTPYVAFATFFGEVTGAPSFINEATQDYGINASSPAKGAGYGVQTRGWLTLTGDNPDIGPMDETGGAGGGGAKNIKTGGAL